MYVHVGGCWIHSQMTTEDVSGGHVVLPLSLKAISHTSVHSSFSNLGHSIQAAAPCNASFLTQVPGAVWADAPPGQLCVSWVCASRYSHCVVFGRTSTIRAK